MIYFFDYVVSFPSVMTCSWTFTKQRFDRTGL
ncbi:hypothetical protein ACVI1N_000107 [Sinorhizobium medicae]